MKTTAAALLLAIDNVAELPRRQRNNAILDLSSKVNALTGLDRVICEAKLQEMYDRHDAARWA